jgi:hypothetical protein
MKIKTEKQIEDYFEGKGCKCCAHDYSECGCDVDWTPKEVYVLRLELKKAKDEIKRLRSKL